MCRALTTSEALADPFPPGFYSEEAEHNGRAYPGLRPASIRREFDHPSYTGALRQSIVGLSRYAEHMREAIERFGLDHKDYCYSILGWGPDAPCDCGLQEFADAYGITLGYED